MKIKTSEATPLQLNWLVATCEGIDDFDCMGVAYVADPDQPHFNKVFRPSTDWSQGGPIVEREKIELIHYGSMGYKGAWEAQIGQDTHYIDQYPGDAIPGPTPLIAAMRAFVASKMGDEVEIPDELLSD